MAGLEEWARGAGEIEDLCPSVEALDVAGFESAVLGETDEEGIAIVHFFVRDLPISKYAASALEGVAQNGWQVFGIDCEAEASTAVAERFAIGSMPTVVLFRGGRLAAHYSGFLGRTEIGQWAVRHSQA